MLHGADFAVEFDSIADAVAEVDLVVRGRVATAQLAEVVPIHPDDDEVMQYVRVSVAVDEVLQGVPQSRSVGEIEVVLWLPDVSKWDIITANMPEYQSLFFLLNTASDLERHGFSTAEREPFLFDYIPPNDQWILRNINGRTRGFLTRDGRFPASLEGLEFESIVEDVEREVASR